MEVRRGNWTPGPWATYHDGRDSESTDIVVKLETNDRIATTCPQETAGLEFANSYLLAAAPELYDALENMVNVISGYMTVEHERAKARHGEQGPMQEPDFMTQAKAALAKAHGSHSGRTGVE